MVKLEFSASKIKIAKLQSKIKLIEINRESIKIINIFKVTLELISY